MSLHIIDIWHWMIAGRGCPMHCGISGTSPGLDQWMPVAYPSHQLINHTSLNVYGGRETRSPLDVKHCFTYFQKLKEWSCISPILSSVRCTFFCTTKIFLKKHCQLSCYILLRVRYILTSEIFEMWRKGHLRIDEIWSAMWCWEGS